MIVQLTCARHEDSHALFSIMILEVAFCALPGEREVNKIINWKTFPGGPVVKTSPSGLDSGPGAKIQQASWSKNQNRKQKQGCNKFNRDLKNGSH